MYDGKIYKSYDNWLEFAIDLSDYYTFTKRYTDILKARNLEEQLDLLPNLQEYPRQYCATLEKMIEDFGLWEFDYFA